MENPKFLTLTVQRVLLSRSSVKRLRGCFTRLRHMKGWKAVGGLYQIEVGTIDDYGMCNLHIHSVIDSVYMAQAEIVRMWRKATDGWGYIVDIRACKKGDVRSLINYMTKHMAKMPDGRGMPEWIHALVNESLRGARLVQTFGNVKMGGLRLRQAVCPVCGSANVMVEYGLSRDDLLALEGMAGKAGIVPA